MRVIVLLADKGTANPPQSTLNLLNAGWKQTMLRPSPMPIPGGQLVTGPHVVAIFFEAEPQYCNRPIELVISLVDDDGQPVQLPGPAGPQVMRIAQQVTILSPGGVPFGTPGAGNTMIDIFPGLPVEPGGYRWDVTLAGEEGPDWFASFRVLAPPANPLGSVQFGATPPAPPET